MSLSQVKILKSKVFSAGSTVTGEVLTTGNGTTTIFSVTADLPVVVAKSVTVTAGSIVLTDPLGQGVLSGTGASGTINYFTGAITLTYAVAPANALNITINYTKYTVSPFSVVDYDTTVAIAANRTKYYGQLPQSDIVPGSVTFSVNFNGVTTQFTDSSSSNGTLTGNNLVVGAINYSDGTFLLMFYTTPDASQNIIATYHHRNTQSNEQYIKSGTTDLYNYITVTNSTGSEVQFHLIDSETLHGTYSLFSTLLVPANSSLTKPITASKYVKILSAVTTALYIELSNQGL